MHKKSLQKKAFFSCGPTWARTRDHLIMSVEIENLRIDNQIVKFLKVNKTIHFNTFLHL
jgi:hypothetical protein